MRLGLVFFIQSIPLFPVFNDFLFSGGYSEEETPVPIPNTEVKLFSADGTARVTAWESRTPPGNYFWKAPPFGGAFFFL